MRHFSQEVGYHAPCAGLLQEEACILLDQLLSFLAPSAPSFREHLLQRKDSSSKKIHRISRGRGQPPGEREWFERIVTTVCGFLLCM